MKGIGGIAVAAVFMLLMLGVGLYATDSGRTFVASLAASFTAPAATFDPACQPGTILKPQFSTTKCEINGKIGTQTFQYYSGGDCAWGSYCIKASCAASDSATTRPCTLNVNSGNFQLFSSELGCNPPNGCKGIKTYSLNHGSQVMLTFTGYAGVSAYTNYDKMGLRFYDLASGVFQREIGDGCDVSNFVGTDAYKNWPDSQPKTMTLGQSFQMVSGWQSYPVAGNYIQYGPSKVDAECVNEGQTSNVYSYTKYDGLGGCYYYRGNVIASGQCCPGNTNSFGQTCDVATLTWKSGPVTGQCCPSPGMCSVSYCPGQGSLAWDQWSIGQPVKSYNCDSTTAQCVVRESKTAMCNPLTNLGCPTTKRCDAVTYTCTDLPDRQYECVETGRECCVSGQVPSNVKLRTCLQAGFPSDYLCKDGFCYAPVPPNVCNYDKVCQAGEDKNKCPDCNFNPWGFLLSFLIYWIVGTIIMAVVLLAASFFWPPLHFLMRDKRMLLLAAAGLGLLVSFMFTPLVASVASMAGVA